jgi:hypothetical protein
MSIIIPQDGDRVQLQPGHELINRQRGIVSRHTMFIVHCEEILYKKLGDKRPLALHLFLKLAMSLTAKGTNIAPLHIPSLMEYFNTSQRSIYNAMQVLKDTDLMRKQSKGHYLLNPHVVWCGNHGLRIKAVQQWDADVVLQTMQGVNNV